MVLENTGQGWESEAGKEGGLQETWSLWGQLELRPAGAAGTRPGGTCPLTALLRADFSERGSLTFPSCPFVDRLLKPLGASRQSQVRAVKVGQHSGKCLLPRDTGTALASPHSVKFILAPLEVISPKVIYRGQNAKQSRSPFG